MFRKFALLTGDQRRRALTLIAANVAAPRLPCGGLATVDGLLPGTDLFSVAPRPRRERELDPMLVRRDITEGHPGIPTVVRLQVVDADRHPVQSARVDVWQCDASGAYAKATEPDCTFLRGTQFSDDNGVVEFVTIFPGTGAGRSPCIHFAVGLAGTELAGEIEFSETVATFIHETVPAYGGSGADLPAALLCEGEAYLAQLIVGPGEPPVEDALTNLPATLLCDGQAYSTERMIGPGEPPAAHAPRASLRLVS